jgi:hypothetical protein
LILLFYDYYVYLTWVDVLLVVHAHVPLAAVLVGRAPLGQAGVAAVVILLENVLDQARNLKMNI